ncbi:hypothetical protein BGW36DRAFT_380296 [Talaromyces proteolyticus]|uniref:G-patch domain-containing protein n=1 Tax=Talaromyces proteolyticus TaxID=1131652 RepID=A0AAD4KSJ8_9EURO|nr:uncharacterized protein BGW36DRAFT_380296 [Talaromyces proteolyticus]KAH8696120.1 hypothetical protein BGW36DRAFT_380296 [Talaromyces proteolyticus]
MSSPVYDDEDYVVPLEDQRVFGAGIKRKRVPFVRASDDLQTTFAKDTTEPSATVADKYFAIVMSKKRRKEEERLEKQRNDDNIITAEELASAPATSTTLPAANTQQQLLHTEDTTPSAHITSCEICSLPIAKDSAGEKYFENETELPSKPPNTPHEASIAHQVCLEHSHPPSHLDRTSRGFRYLASYGWDPDNRIGLGMAGRTGIREPIKTKAKNDTIGLGLNVDESTTAAKKKLRQQHQEQHQKLNAKQVRNGQIADRKKGDKLRELFYGSDDIQRYLGET